MKYHGDKLLFDDGRTFATIDPGVRQEEVYKVLDLINEAPVLDELRYDLDAATERNLQLRKALDAVRDVAVELQEKVHELEEASDEN